MFQTEDFQAVKTGSRMNYANEVGGGEEGGGEGRCNSEANPTQWGGEQCREKALGEFEADVVQKWPIDGGVRVDLGPSARLRRPFPPGGYKAQLTGLRPKLAPFSLICISRERKRLIQIMPWVVWLCLFFIILFTLPFLPMALELCCTVGDVTEITTSTTPSGAGAGGVPLGSVEYGKPKRTGSLPPSYEEATRLPPFNPHRPVVDVSCYI